MSDIRGGMPVLSRHVGEWAGSYTHIDADGRILDSHRSRLRCWFPESGPYAYMQQNTYEWADGRQEQHEFPASYADGRILWDTPRIVGHAWEIDGRTICLTWKRKDLVGFYLYEMIQISDDDARRGRTWHWFENDTLVRRTCITETRTG
jgi:hypothetical protein